MFPPWIARPVQQTWTVQSGAYACIGALALLRSVFIGTVRQTTIKDSTLLFLQRQTIGPSTHQLGPQLRIMHISQTAWLVLPAALLPTVAAFYPYGYADDSSPGSAARRTNPSSNTQSKTISVPIRRARTPLRSRQSVFNIVHSKDPSEKNSVAIDQDGRDISYVVAVTFGDSKEEYNLLLDSAASNTWVMAQDCESEACKMHNTFGKGDSSTLEVRDWASNNMALDSWLTQPL